MMSKDSKSSLYNEIKISDFGFSCFCDPKEGLTSNIGTVSHMAPELQKSQVYNTKVDVWAVGVMAHTLISGKKPFPGINDHEIKMLICDYDFELKFQDWKNISENAKDFVLKALTKDYTIRPSASDLLEHPWIKGFGNSS